MSVDLFIPKLGQTVEEVVLINWLVEDGTKVEFGDPILEVETDKAIFNVEANAKGYIHFGPQQIGETIPVLTVVATIGGENDGFDPKSPETVQSPEHKEPEPDDIESNRYQSQEEQSHKKPDSTPAKIFASPRAKRLANERGVDLSKVKPTGNDGQRIIEDDILSYLNTQSQATPIAAAFARDVGLSLDGISGTGPKGIVTRSDILDVIRDRLTQTPTSSSQTRSGVNELTIVHTKPIKGIQKRIFDKMGESAHTTAQVTLMTEADVTDLVDLRENLKRSYAAQDLFVPGYNELLGVIVARTLPTFPYMNARLNHDESAIEYLAEVNLGFAVDTDRGLIVPVIKDADKLDLQAFCSVFREAVSRAKSGKLQPVDLSNGTFTLTNLGNYAVDGFTPVINLPQAAILGAGRIHDKVIPYQGDIGIRKMITLSLVFDHRLIDGAPAARFLQKIKDTLEDALNVFEKDC